MGRVQAHKRTQKAKRQTTAEFTRQEVPADCYAVEGKVVTCLPNTMFHVLVTTTELTPMIGQTLIATLAGKMRLYRIRVMPGDEVRGYVSKYDLKKLKITYRATKNASQSN